MSTTQQHSTVPSTAVVVAPGLWRTNLQRYDLSVPRTRDDPVASRHRAGLTPIRHTHPGEEIIYVLGVLNESIAAGREASARLQPATQGQPLILASLAGSLQLRGLRLSSDARVTTWASGYPPYRRSATRLY